MSLTNSIEKTGFWDNLVGRKIKGEIQIAYGHHRVEALRLAEGFGYDFEFDLPIKNIDDGTMIQIMANENMQEWGHSIGVVDETVKVAKEYLEGRTFSEKRPTNNTKKEYQGKVNAPELAEFLGWSLAKVHSSLKRLNLINEGSVEREAVESLPSETHATNFAKEIAKSEVKFTPQEQKEIAKEIKKDEVSTKEVKNVIQAKAFEKQYPKEEKRAEPKVDKRKQALMSFDDWLRRISFEAVSTHENLKQLSKFKEELKDVSRENILNRMAAMKRFEEIAKEVNGLLEYLKK